MKGEVAVTVLDMGQAVKEIEDGLGLSDEELAFAAGIAPRAIESCRSGAPRAVGERPDALDRLVALKVRLYDTFVSAEAVHAWMHAAHRYLRGSSPAEAARSGDLVSVEHALEALDAGIFI